ncbi:penicillin-binding protein [Actinoalloteichus sp. AHMU CJ021]|uniref:CubicO group peptidase, beta-lactamase class C family n=3 Tax=Actinoalloteichus cyanogriseus TaxID=2893586 RepID=A0ABT1JDF1_ACTCY|nr:serine hydrolase domain-containing protein [Actinoalloteichus caeruleus]AUS81051.1 penicillin-binding protein [Actinoalloteichus sp. AHMU CJ021]MCP2330532.1 CubicO group peptidase, beta-lactamase class C family [Actinoalloteichus caeruleus DSM 43889]
MTSSQPTGRSTGPVGSPAGPSDPASPPPARPGPTQPPDPNQATRAAPWLDADTLRRALRHAARDARAPGAVVGLVTATGGLAIGVGTPDRSSDEAVTADTHFEWGSITKTVTALTLARLVAEGVVHYDDPVTRYLPDRARPTGRHPVPTLHQLATHTAGLPRLPRNLAGSLLRGGPRNPYAHYDAEALYRAVRATTPRDPPGTRVRYSNLGYGLLGHALGRATGGDYETAVDLCVGRPLGFTPAAGPPAGARRATGHHGRRRTPPWRMTALAGAGVLAGSVTELARYVRAHLRPDETVPPGHPALSRALRDVQRPRADLDAPQQTCLAWHRRTTPDGVPVLLHSGVTWGFTSFVSFAPAAGLGVVAVANTGAVLRAPVTRAAYHLLRGLVDDWVAAGRP